LDDALVDEFHALWDEADRLWDKHQNAPAFRAYVSADYQVVYEALLRLRGRFLTLLEWGSGLGVVSIMASRLGFKAYGIEAESGLVELSENLARSYGSEARFTVGNFIPDEFEWDPSNGDEFHDMSIDGPSAYAELDMELRDFDLVYVYPWPCEHSLYHNVMRRFGGRNSLLLSYDVREGIALNRFNRG
jgi:hypothetical protein